MTCLDNVSPQQLATCDEFSGAGYKHLYAFWELKYEKL